MQRTGPALLAATLLVACTPPDETDSSPEVRLYALDCGRIHISDADFYADDGSFAGEAHDLVDPCYLIRHPDGDLVWDTGLAPATDGTAWETHAFEVPVSLEGQLAELGLAPADIDFFSVSHSHFDHTGNAALFTQARWIVDEDEHAWMFREEARQGEDFVQIAPLEQAETVLIEGDGDYDVFGDGSVLVVQTPGHTPGHTVLLVNLEEAGPVLLAGDMWHMAESRERRTVPRFNTDRAETLRSMDKVETLAERTGARIVRQHVAEDFEALPAFPDPLR